MKVFISWSGDKSREVAKALHEWIPDIIQNVEPWMSKIDINAGARWNNEIAQQLETTKFGIICLTSDNLSKPWILFEAGALAKTIDNDTYVCPYLIDLEPTSIPAGPLTQFQAKRATKDETLELIQSLNSVLIKDALEDDRLKRTFERCWPDLENKISNLPPEGAAPQQRETREMVEEILESVRDFSRVHSEDHSQLAGWTLTIANAVTNALSPESFQPFQSQKQGLAGFGVIPGRPQGLKKGLATDLPNLPTRKTTDDE